MGRNYFVLLLPMLLIFCGEQTNLSSGFNIEVSGELYQETFTPNTLAVDALDILLVIDGSGSMSNQRAEIARKLEALLEHIKKRNWQIGITSTDATGCFAAIINANTPDYQDVYRQAIDDIKESDAEQAIYMAIEGLRGMPVHKGKDKTCDDNKPEYLLRPESAVGILIVTNEDHQCIDLHKNFDKGCEIQDLYDFLSLIRIPNVTAKVYGFLDETDKFLAWRDESGESIFTRHEHYKTSDYSTTLKAISSDLRDIVQYKYKLQKKHDDEAAEVIVTSSSGTSRTLGKNEYGIVGKKLFILTTLPADTSNIKITYSYQP